MWFLLLYLSFVLLRKKGEYCFWTGFVFLTGQVIFVPKWPNGEFVSFIGYIMLTKSLPYKAAAL
jgi:hypothetical protein